MQEKSRGLKVLLWCEVIVAARILLFGIPVIMSQFLLANKPNYNAVGEWFLAIVTIAAFFYLIVGVLALVGHAKWKFFHYLVVLLVFGMSGVMVMAIHKMNMPVHYYYLFPAIISLVIAFYLIAIQKAEKCVCNSSA